MTEQTPDDTDRSDTAKKTWVTPKLMRAEDAELGVPKSESGPEIGTLQGVAS